MNALSRRPIAVSQSRLALAEWAEKEKQALNCAVDEQGCLLDNLTLELRVHPPEVNVDNSTDAKSTVVTIDSANRPGSLVFVVQHFTELGLRINGARISSDGGWFHDMFHISEANGEKVRNPKKLQSIRQMLNVYMQDEELAVDGDETDDMNRVETTVFQLAGVDRAGLLADVTHLLTHNGSNVRSAAVWTYKGRVAFVLSVTEKGKPIEDAIKLERLRQLVTQIMQSGGGSAAVRINKVRGEVHHDRRLHQLMLQEEVEEWQCQNRDGKAQPPPRPASPDSAELLHTGTASIPERQHTDSCDLDAASSGSSCGGGGSSPNDSAMSVHTGSTGKGGLISPYRSPKFDRPAIDISHCSHPDYWTVSIRCRDRTKLLFDTVCTLADMDYDIYHATIDSDTEGGAYQEYYLRPRSGDGEFSRARAALLKAMLAQSIERRFPKGLKVHVRSLDRFGCLAALARQLQQTGLTVTRAKVRTFATSKSSGHTLYVMSAAGGPPDKERVQQACESIGGRAVDAEDLVEGKALPPSVDSHRFSFSFSFLNRQWNTTWGGSPTDGGWYGSF